MRLVLAGTPAPALVALEALLASRHDVVGVLTRPEARAGRGRAVAASPVAERATGLGLPVLAPRRLAEPEFLAALAELAPDCVPVVAYGALVPRAALDVPPLGWVNLHFSLLPAWRGAAPVQHALMAGDELTGATTFLLDDGLDTGPVLGVVTELVRPRDTAGDLLGRLSASGARLLVATLDALADGTAVPVAQPADGVSLAPKITVAGAAVDWGRPALAVDRAVRATTPEPGAWTTFRGARLRLGPVEPDAGVVDLAPGALRAGRREVHVGTGSHAVRLGTVQPAGRTPVPAADWARGARPADDEILGA